MSALLQVSMALFDASDVSYVHDQTSNPPDNLVIGFPANPQSFASLNWIYDPAFGFPGKPHEVVLFDEQLNTEDHAVQFGPIALEETNRFRVDLGQYLAGFGFKFNLSEGGFCVTARVVDSNTNVEVYATDILGKELPGTRQTADNYAVAFLGPHVFGLRATGYIKLEEIVLFGVPNNFDGSNTLIAEVAPTFPLVQSYNDQSYLGTALDATDALQQRLYGDAIARNNTQGPLDSELQVEVHARNPFDFAKSIEKQDFFVAAQDMYADLMADPTLEISQDFDGGLNKATYQPARLWQLLACSGSIEANVMGQAVTIPLELAWKIATKPTDIYESVTRDNLLPFPLILVRSSFGKKAPRPELVSYARLVLAPSGVSAEVTATSSRPPTKLDGPATADLEVRLKGSRVHAGCFIGRERDGIFDFERDDTFQKPPPRLFFFNGQLADQSAQGAPIVRLGPVDLPFDRDDVETVHIVPRDVFGRWAEKTVEEGTLKPWQVSAPKLLSTEVMYGADGTALLSQRFAWDWSLRRPFEIRMGLCLGADCDNATPADFLNLPQLEDVPPIVIRFDGAGTPFIKASHPVHQGFKVRQVPLHDLVAPNELPDPSSDLRQYEVIGPLGKLEGVFGKAARERMVITADAFEKVSGQTDDRRSDHDRKTETILDPRPPVFVEDTWRINWTARPNAAGFATTRIRRPHLAPGSPAAAGFNLWRAGETAVLNLAIQKWYGDTPQGEKVMAKIRAERNLTQRLRLIQPLVTAFLDDAAFLREFVNLFAVENDKPLKDDAQVDVSGTLDGFEFAMYSAISENGVASEKTDLKHLVAIAVPKPRIPKRPDLRVITEDALGLLPLSGQWLVLVGTDTDVAEQDLRFYWDDNSLVKDADQLLNPLVERTSLTAADAALYVPDIDGMAKRMQRQMVFHFLVSPPQSWRRLSITVEIVSEKSHVPEENAVSPRALLFSGFMPPVAGPRLTLVTSTSGTKERVVSQTGLFTTLVPGFEDCEVLIEIAQQEPAQTLRYGPTNLESFTVPNGIEVGQGIKVIYDKEQESFFFSHSGSVPPPSLTMTCSDPLRRVAHISI